MSDMQVLRGLDSLPAGFGGGAAVTIGFFDGVHLGHQALLRRTVEVAAEQGLTPVAVTFAQHPKEILTPGKEPRLLTTIDRKTRLIEAMGIEATLVIDFDRDFSLWPPDGFCDRILVDGLHAKHVIVGANFTFGFKAVGTPATLMELGATRDLAVEALDLVELDGRRVSSSSIRDAVAAGDLAWPERALGRRYAVDGEVVSGHGRGRGLGFPTANLETWPRLLLPGQGIYAGRAIVGADAHVAAIDVGTNPTFGIDPLHVESFLLDYDGNLVGEHMDVEFWSRLRDEVQYDSAEELIDQIARDVEQTRAIVQP